MIFDCFHYFLTIYFLYIENISTSSDFGLYRRWSVAAKHCMTFTCRWLNASVCCLMPGMQFSRDVLMKTLGYWCDPGSLSNMSQMRGRTEQWVTETSPAQENSLSCVWKQSKRERGERSCGLEDENKEVEDNEGGWVYSMHHVVYDEYVELQMHGSTPSGVLMGSKTNWTALVSLSSPSDPDPHLWLYDLHPQLPENLL